MCNFFLHINGTGNAWPVPLGEEHPFYDRNDPGQLGNASVSLLKKTQNRIDSELIVDAGHGVIQHLLKNRNRIPEALVITHPHLDHTLSLDWIAQSYFKRSEKLKKFPVYCTAKCFRVIMQYFPHLEGILQFKELVYGSRKEVAEMEGVSLYTLPVYHGKASPGSAAVVLSVQNKDQVLITGDILFPVFRTIDYEKLSGINWLVADANNRFPYPRSNHWSVTASDPGTGKFAERLKEFIVNFDNNEILQIMRNSMDEKDPIVSFLNENRDTSTVYCLTELVNRIGPKNTLLIHFSGDEDLRYYHELKPDRPGLKKWLEQIRVDLDLNTIFHVPETGDEFTLL